MKVTNKQLLLLKELIKSKQKGICQENSKSRYIFEKFVNEGLAFKNQGTRKHETSTGSSKYVAYTYYTAAPEAHRTVLDAIDRAKHLIHHRGKRLGGMITATRNLSLH